MSAPTPQPIACWLEKLGLGQYDQQFVDNKITLSILPDLTDADLKELGVAALGHRRLLPREIANLGKTAVASPSAPSLTAPPNAAPTVSYANGSCRGLLRQAQQACPFFKLILECRVE
jgi:SAM domain (Sterile alpha motif)